VDEERAFAQRLARDGAPVDPHPADDVLPLHERDALAGAGGLDRGSLAAWATAEDDDIEADLGCSLG